jgi:hypothetical protein
MGRNAKDPELTKLARKLMAVEMQDEGCVLEGESTEILNDSRSLRYVQLMPNMKTWAVRLYVGGLNRIIGFSNRLSTALRYADMAAMTFWPYRIRGACEPVDADLNFSVEQAKEDLANETDAVKLLDEIVNYLKDAGAIPDIKKLNEQRKLDRKEREKRKTVRYEFMQLHETQMSVLAEINERLKHLEAVIAQKQINPEWVRASHDLLLQQSPYSVFKRSVPNPEWRAPEKGEVTGVGFSTYESDRKIVAFKVYITEHHYVEIQVPVRIENGQEILLPEAHELIERTRREGRAAHEEAMRDITEPQPAPEPAPIAATDVSLSLGVEELFSPTTNNPTT